VVVVDVVDGDDCACYHHEGMIQLIVVKNCENKMAKRFPQIVLKTKAKSNSLSLEIVLYNVGYEVELHRVE